MLDIAASNGIVADNINKIIEEKSLKQSAIACKAGFTPQEFNAMLRGRKLMRAVDIASILDGCAPRECTGKSVLRHSAKSGRKQRRRNGDQSAIFRR